MRLGAVDGVGDSEGHGELEGAARGRAAAHRGTRRGARERARGADRGAQAAAARAALSKPTTKSREWGWIVRRRHRRRDTNTQMFRSRTFGVSTFLPPTIIFKEENAVKGGKSIDTAVSPQCVAMWGEEDIRTTNQRR